MTTMFLWKLHPPLPFSFRIPFDLSFKVTFLIFFFVLQSGYQGQLSGRRGLRWDFWQRNRRRAAWSFLFFTRKHRLVEPPLPMLGRVRLSWSSVCVCVCVCVCVWGGGGGGVKVQQCWSKTPIKLEEIARNWIYKTKMGIKCLGYMKVTFIKSKFSSKFTAKCTRSLSLPYSLD